jgi:hypothetical protein
MGQDVTLTCTVKDDNIGFYDASWHKMIPGVVPKIEMIGASRPFDKTYYHTISGLQPEDEGDYYCSTWNNDLSAHTLLSVHGELRQQTALGLL